MTIKERQIKVLELYHQGLGCRKIAKILNISKNTILRDYQDLELNTGSRHLLTFQPIKEKYCNECKEIKPTSEFRRSSKSN